MGFGGRTGFHKKIIEVQVGRRGGGPVIDPEGMPKYIYPIDTNWPMFSLLHGSVSIFTFDEKPYLFKAKTEFFTQNALFQGVFKGPPRGVILTHPPPPTCTPMFFLWKPVRPPKPILF